MTLSKEDIDELGYRILSTLQSNPAITQRDLAAALGISLGRTNYCLRRLVQVGFVTMRNLRNSHRKRGYAYKLTAEGQTKKTEAAHRFLREKEREQARLAEQIAQLRAEVRGAQAHTRNEIA
ncbi:MarR family EPS-associated transcriptional regulator [Algiphilus sp. NNCM1]|uniref:MarR family EPS-associated transcriptional regulator n=1 Tax=Algiphilus sp. TaxID=1872431 RepID=UPI001CA65E36|nr:MarR family EPS-associated transcriptional regulator [Algiphilus sp.]MBY8965024.1 MarR family EPS-associated transcriptional regulator [Algiphilus acroporae]MCI5104180.1 MarR family EPS-associated transcriptional regulator [Algiphilus sp.]